MRNKIFRLTKALSAQRDDDRFLHDSLGFSSFSMAGDGPYNIFSRFSSLFLNSLDRMEFLIALGTQRKRVTSTPTPTEPRIVKIKGVLNSQGKNFKVTGETPAFWIAKIARQMTTKNINQ
jgi:hypothetical protein